MKFECEGFNSISRGANNKIYSMGEAATAFAKRLAKQEGAKLESIEQLTRGQHYSHYSVTLKTSEGILYSQKLGVGKF